MTRILSVFNLLKRVGFALLFEMCITVSAGIAQPGVEWGESTWIGLNGSTVSVVQAVPMGDSIVFSGRDEIGRVYTCYTHNHGIEISDWLHMPAGTTGNDFIHLSGSRGEVLACITDYQPQNPALPFFRVSHDAGAVWSPTLSPRSGSNLFGFVSGNYMHRIHTLTPNEDRYVIRFYTSIDSGASWFPPYIMEDSDSLTVGFNSIAATNETIILLGKVAVTLPWNSIRYTVGNRHGDDWQSWIPLPNQPYDSLQLSSFAIAADTSSETAVVASSWYDWNNPTSPHELWVTLSHNGGYDWNNPIRLTNPSSLGFGTEPFVLCNGPLFGIVWHEINNEGGNSVSWVFSANYGANWYPKQIISEDVSGYPRFFGQILVDQVNVFWTQTSIDENLDLRMAVGELSVDNTSPTIVPLSLPPDTMTQIGEQTIEVRVTDDDTLSSVELFLVGVNSDTISVLMSSEPNRQFIGQIDLAECGIYSFWLVATDFWMNDARYPTDGPRRLVVCEQSDAAERSYEELSVDLVISPNPSLGWPTLSTLPNPMFHSHFIVDFYNVLGRHVGEVVLTSQSPSIGLSSISDFSSLPAGIYFLRPRTLARSKVQKFIVLK